MRMYFYIKFASRVSFLDIEVVQTITNYFMTICSSEYSSLAFFVSDVSFSTL